MINGKVERSQKADKLEFYATLELPVADLDQRLSEWQHDYNWQRPHAALQGKTPKQRACELGEATPLWEDVSARYDPAKERFQARDYRADLRLNAVK